MIMNHLLIILDSVSYEVFQEANAKNIRKLGKIGKAYTPAHWTMPTVVSMFYNPYYMGKPLVIMGGYLEHEWVPQIMKRSGYNTSLVADNPWFILCRDFIKRGFDKYRASSKVNLDWVINEAMGCLKPPFFTVVWITSTHSPYFKKTIKRANWTTGNRRNQIRQINVADRYLGKLFKKVPKNTEIVVTADHGESFKGDTTIGHEPRVLEEFDENLFKVFFVRGTK